MVTAENNNNYYTDTNKRNEHSIDNWVIFEADEGIKFIHKDGGNFRLEPALVERIWEMLDHGQQPTRYDGSWNVEQNPDGWGLDFRQHVGSGGSYWGLAPLAYSALLKWREIVRPRTKSEQIVIDLTELQKVLEQDYPNTEYSKLISDAIENIQDRVKNFS